MGLHSPFGYVGYEVKLGRIFVGLLDNLCAHCHTDGDYEKGCRGCPAGILIYECKEYLETYDESDKRFELYASDEWASRANRTPSAEERQRDLEMAEDYRPECNVLRLLKPKMKRIKPEPFLYVRGKNGYRRPKVLDDFANLIEDYDKKQEYRHRKWGIPQF